ncbi:MAG: helix-turn-helix transcriptional regulator [Lachnospiraceae bacterium]|nr:helix-turn-helix transcriptional regulator [Lachnospiraceae bacterium]
MGKKSSKENKNIYHLSREEAGLSREKASEAMVFVSPERIEKIESEKSLPHPDEVLAMSECYKKVQLCNYYCSHDCPIGIEYVPEIKLKELSQIVLEMLATLNSIDRDKDRLIEMSADSRITEDEFKDFINIQDKLNKISMTADSLKLWVKSAIAEGGIDEEKLKKATKAE